MVYYKSMKTNQKQMKITQKILAGLGVVALATGSLGTPAKANGLTNWNLTGVTQVQAQAEAPAAVPAQSQSVSYDQLVNAAHYIAKGLCMAKQGNSPFKELDGRRYSEQDVVNVALKYAGIPNLRNLSTREQNAVVQNQRTISEYMNSDCSLPGLAYSGSVPGLKPISKGFNPAPVAQNNGRTWMERSADYRQECVNHLSNKYGIFTRGQLKTCIGNLSAHDYMNGK